MKRSADFAEVLTLGSADIIFSLFIYHIHLTLVTSILSGQAF